MILTKSVSALGLKAFPVAGGSAVSLVAPHLSVRMYCDHLELSKYHNVRDALFFFCVSLCADHGPWYSPEAQLGFPKSGAGSQPSPGWWVIEDCYRATCDVFLLTVRKQTTCGAAVLLCTAVAVTMYWSKEDSVWTIMREKHSAPLVVSLQDGKGTPSLCMSAPLQTSVCLSSSPCIMLLVVLVSDKHHTVFSTKRLVILSLLLSFSNCCVHERITSWACGELGLKPQNMLRGITLASLHTFENISWTLLRNDSVMIILLQSMRLLFLPHHVVMTPYSSLMLLMLFCFCLHAIYKYNF